MLTLDDHLNQRRQNHAETESPDEGDHEQDVDPAVDLVVAPVVRDQHISDEEELFLMDHFFHDDTI